MVTRPAEKNDLIQLSMLFRKDVELFLSTAGYCELTDNFDWRAYAQMKLNDRSVRITVSEYDGVIAGFIYARIMEYPHKQNEKSILQRMFITSAQTPLSPIKPLKWGVIEQCYVEPDYRRRRIGSSLVDDIAAWFKMKNINRVELSVMSINRGAESFWRNAGFDTFRLHMFLDLQ